MDDDGMTLWLSYDEALELETLLGRLQEGELVEFKDYLLEPVYKRLEKQIDIIEGVVTEV
jgi:hypothetical protein